jgi:hypothetical protein
LGGNKVRNSLIPVLKVPRQCPLGPLVEATRMIGINFYMTLEWGYFTMMFRTGNIVSSSPPPDVVCLTTSTLSFFSLSLLVAHHIKKVGDT